MTTPKRIIDLLKSKRLHLVAAESFTGGGVASALVSVAGASEVFRASLVCYSNEAKSSLLKVKETTLTRFGAVSGETVGEMLDGLASLRLGEVLVATSGNAGPTAEKEGETGVVFIGTSYLGKKNVQRFVLNGNRSQNIAAGIQLSLQMIEKTIIDK